MVPILPSPKCQNYRHLPQQAGYLATEKGTLCVSGVRGDGGGKGSRLKLQLSLVAPPFSPPTTPASLKPDSPPTHTHTFPPPKLVVFFEEKNSEKHKVVPKGAPLKPWRAHGPAPANSTWKGRPSKMSVFIQGAELAL